MVERTHNAVAAARLECRVCHAVIRVPGGGAEGRFRCPKCLFEMDLKSGSPTLGSPAPQASVQPLPEAPAAAVAPGRTPDGTPAASPVPPAPPADTAEELRRLRAEREELATRLQAATVALREAGVLIARLAELEQRLCDLGGSYLQAADRLAELKRENARLRDLAAAPQG